MKEILDSDATISNKDTRERDLLIAFVGIKHDYYLEKWKDKEKLFSKLNFAAFFFAFFWLLYRKMYIELVLAVAIVIVWGVFDAYLLEPIMSPEVLSMYDRISSILVGVIMGMTGNYLYLRSAQRKINKLETEGYSESELFEKVKKAGGTSILSVVIVLISVGALVFYLIESGFLD